MSFYTAACRHSGCSCTQGIFDLQATVATDGLATTPSGPIFSLARHECAACGHGYAAHAAAATAEALPAPPLPATLPVTPVKRPHQSSHTHSHSHPHSHPHSTPLKTNSLSAHSIDPHKNTTTAANKRRRTRSQSTSDGGSYRTSSDRTGHLRHSLAQELEGNVFVDIDGIVDMFGPSATDTIHSSSWWSEPPATLSDKDFVPWLTQTLSRARRSISVGDGVWCDTRKRTLGSDYSTSRKPDFCLVSGTTGGEWDWNTVAVVGEHQSASKSLADCFLQLADYVSHVFAYQPLRLQVHAVLTYKAAGCGLRLFVFDRGGAMGSRVLPLSRHVMLRLACATPVVPAVAGIPLRLPDGSETVLTRTVCRRPGIVSRSTYCAVSEGGTLAPELLVKLSWRAAARTNEGELLRLAAQRGVIGVARHVFHLDLVDVATLRGGLADAQAVPMTVLRRQSSNKPTPDTSHASSEATTPTAAAATPPPAVFTQASFQNRIYTYIIMSTIGTPVADLHRRPGPLAHGLLGSLIGHASLFFTGRLLHRDVSASNVLYSATPLRTSPDPAAGADAIRMAERLIPLGMPALHGFLIDLDYAIHYTPTMTSPSSSSSSSSSSSFARTPSGAPHRTGTLPYMAIGVLWSELHTYRHDLESFLYILLSILRGSPPAEWSSGHPENIARLKRGLMTNTTDFERFLGSAPGGGAGAGGKLLDVAREWRNVLFRVVEGVDRDDDVYDVKPARAGWVKKGVTEWEAFVSMRDNLWRAIREAEGDVAS
ncbi:hypothetical protein DFH27DRAFT_310243 [Peziza echinospora]|nr:hypothetical protein DFH27DRAFT_310243 [Peziza echinospora]